MNRRHEMQFGAECTVDGNVRFRLWAPQAPQVILRLEDNPGKELLMKSAGEGWHELVSPEARSGTRYRFRINQELVPDPASRFQPEGVHRPSEVVDPNAYDWKVGNWRGRPWDDAVIYELHVGTFSREGTYSGVEKKLDYLRELGVTAIELMPLSSFPGERNWGYDGVLPYAPARCYGPADDLKRLIDGAQ